MWESLAVGHLLEVASYLGLEIEGGSVHEAPAECLLNEPKAFLHILGNYRQILKKVKVKAAPACLNLGYPMGYSLPGSSVHGIL